MEKEIKKIEDLLQRTGSKRGHYSFISVENKAKIAKYASEHGVTALLRHFKQTGEFTELKESTVHGWVTVYQGQLAMRSREVTAFPGKRGRPLLLGKELESYGRKVIQELHSANRTANTATVLATAKDVILAKDANLLVENGGNIDFSEEIPMELIINRDQTPIKFVSVSYLLDS